MKESPTAALRRAVQTDPNADDIAPTNVRRLDEARCRKRGLTLKRMSDVEPEEVGWLWENRLPCGKLTLLVGDPEAGKTFVTLDFAARISTAASWPDGGVAPQGDVLLLAVEDGLADTIRPRLDALHADVSRIYVVDGVYDGGESKHFTLADNLDELEQTVKGKGVRLVVIDPVNAYLGSSINSWKDDNVRTALTPLAQMAERTGTAIVGIMHLSKNEERAVLNRVLGSIGFVAVARVVMHAKQGENGDNRRTLSVLKNNLAPKAPDLLYRIVDGRLVWECPEPGSIPRAGRSATARDRAKRFLQLKLADGPRLVATVELEAELEGVSQSALRKAREALGIETFKKDFDDKRWWCRLPDEPATGPLTPVEMSEMGEMDKMESPHLVQPDQVAPPGDADSVPGRPAA